MEPNQTIDKKKSASAEDFATMFEESVKTDLPQEGDIVKGTVLKISGDQVFIDFSYKCEGSVPANEFAGAGGELTIQAGDEVEVYFEGVDKHSFLAILSKERADALKVWDRLVDAADTGGVVEGTILHKVKGGLSVDIGVKAFLPGSPVSVPSRSHFANLVRSDVKRPHRRTQ
jgi:small subunit ribosomal protein S1